MGLSGLSHYPTKILSVDVIGGTVDYVLLNLTVGLTNPSNLDFKLGDITFQLYGGKDFLGTTTIPVRPRLSSRLNPTFTATATATATDLKLLGYGRISICRLVIKRCPRWVTFKPTRILPRCRR